MSTKIIVDNGRAFAFHPDKFNTLMAWGCLAKVETEHPGDCYRFCSDEEMFKDPGSVLTLQRGLQGVMSSLLNRDQGDY